MNTSWDAPENQPLRFNPPDGWRTPDPVWVALHQGFEPPDNWQPYPDCPPAPPQWPWWEENGAAWFGFFRHFQPPLRRGLGNWFSLVAIGLFLMTATPFFLDWPAWLIVGVGGMLGGVVGVIGIIRHFRTSAKIPHEDPMDIIRRVASDRRDDYFHKRYEKHRQTSATEKSYQEFIDGLYVWWWRENASVEES